MKFPHKAKIFRGRFDAVPFAGVLFLLVLFLVLASLVYTPGVRITLPSATDLPGTDKPTLTVAVDAAGKFYFENQLIPESELKLRLSDAAKKTPEPLTLIVQADKAVTTENLVRLTQLARDAGIQEALLATLPRTFDPSPASRP